MVPNRINVCIIGDTIENIAVCSADPKIAKCHHETWLALDDVSAPVIIACIRSANINNIIVLTRLRKRGGGAGPTGTRRFFEKSHGGT